MRNPVFVLESLQEKACSTGYQFERLYRNLYNPDFYLLAYKNIAASKGSMTAGADGVTLDGMSMTRINKIIAVLKDHSYQPNPARREYIEKKNSSKKRPLGIQSTDDKLVQEIVRMILESIYEPTFSNYSHGFRPNRSCHTALLQVQRTLKGAKWIVEGDIKACFDCFDHHVLINILRRRIKDEYFIALIWKFLKAGYMEQWTYHKTYSGTPQGSGASPILANIYLSELDAFLEQYSIEFQKRDSVRRTLSREYKDATNRYYKALKELERSKANGDQADITQAVADVKSAQKGKQQTLCHNAVDPSFKTIHFNRYADDFVIGVNGSKSDAEKIKEDIRHFLQNTLRLTLSEEKTKITHSSELIRYLGYDFSVSRSRAVKRNKNGALGRYWYGIVTLYVPHEKWEAKLREYRALKIRKDKDGSERWQATHRGKLMNRDDIAIISQYNAEIRGIYNFYRLAANASVLSRFAYIMQISMYRTFAAKYKTKVSKLKPKYERGGIWGVDYETKAGSKRCEFYHDGFRQDQDAADSFVDLLPRPRKYGGVNTLADRLRAGKCELCGCATEDIRIHHVKALKDLTGKNEAEMLMMKRRRKTLALCLNCFSDVHS